MKYTSAEANKLLKTLEKKREKKAGKEKKVAKFTVSSTENVEELRPGYDFADTQQQLAKIDEDIRKVKHAINVFNVTHEIPGFDGVTIDQALIWLPQMNIEAKKLAAMAESIERERVESFRTTIIDYVIANYDIEEAEKAYDEMRDKLNKLQLALDVANTTQTIEIDVETN